MRRIDHPGPVGTAPCTALPATLVPLNTSLPPGSNLLDGLATMLQAHGCQSAVARLSAGGFTSLRYAMPALSKTADHAVYFSDPFTARGPVSLLDGTVTIGQRDGKTWLHCHARWRDADGALHCGHLLPDEAWLADGMQVQAWLLQGSGFEVQADSETRFSLFKPSALTGPQAPGAQRAWVLRLAPNADVCEAIEAFCRAQGIHRGRIRGGVGSTVGACFDDGRVVEPFVTETLITRGQIEPDAQGQPMALIDVAMVDYTGGQAAGRLARGQNPVLVTFELVIEPL